MRFVAAYRSVVFGGEVQRLMTASFFHLSLVHVVANSIGLLTVGSHPEWRVGTPRFVVIALASAAGSIAGSVLIQYVPWVVGASGLVYGLYGALTGLLVRYWNEWDFDHAVPRWSAVGGMVVLLVVSQAVALRALPGFAVIDEANHWSGFVVGAIVTLVLTRTSSARTLLEPTPTISRLATGVGFLFAFAFVLQGGLLLVRGPSADHVGQPAVRGDGARSPTEPRAR